MITPAFYFKIKVTRSEASIFGPAEAWIKHPDGRPKIFFWQKDVDAELARLSASTISPNISYQACRFPISDQGKEGIASDRPARVADANCL
jgi:hypothetical protein